jgi:hypothetical protein
VSEWHNGSCSGTKTLRIEQRQNDSDHIFSIKVLLKWVGFKNVFCLFAERHTFELERSDGGPKYEK